MNIRLDDFNCHLAIAGFRDVKLKDVNKFFQAVKGKTDDLCMQFFDASLVAGWEHLLFAALGALNAFKAKVNISGSLAMETLLYSSAQRQIKDAVNLIGIKPSSRHMAVVVLASSQKQASDVLKVVSQLLGGEQDFSVLELTDNKIASLRKLFHISAAELEAKAKHNGLEKQTFADLVIEHMALLITRR
jgi:tRNA threonylcarbamoyladenosine modification (KEOPS) complex Cgi121 subunit